MPGRKRTEAAALNQIQQQDAELKNQNSWKGVSALSGSAQLEDPLGYGNSANQGSSVVGSLGTACNQTQQNSFWSKLGDSFASSLGKGLASGNGSTNALLGGGG